MTGLSSTPAALNVSGTFLGKSLLTGAFLDRCTIHAFDDKGTTGPVITRRSWFTRLMLVLGPKPFLAASTPSSYVLQLYSP